MASNGLRVALQLGLWLVIVALGYFLYYSITEPYEAVKRAEALTEETRQRMDVIRQVAIHYETQFDRYPGTIDSLEIYAKQDSAFQLVRDSILKTIPSVDSLIFSPRNGQPFFYQINDTSRVKTYLLKDPLTADSIGTVIPNDITLVNAASWE